MKIDIEEIGELLTKDLSQEALKFYMEEEYLNDSSCNIVEVLDELYDFQTKLYTIIDTKVKQRLK